MRKRGAVFMAWRLIFSFSIFLLWSASAQAKALGLKICGRTVTSDNYTNLAAIAANLITVSPGGVFTYDPNTKTEVTPKSWTKNFWGAVQGEYCFLEGLPFAFCRSVARNAQNNILMIDAKGYCLLYGGKKTCGLYGLERKLYSIKETCLEKRRGCVLRHTLFVENICYSNQCDK